MVVVGSQAILATRPDDDLPIAATRSLEADVAAPHTNDDGPAHLLSGVLGEDSAFHHAYGYFVDGVDVSTATLPDDWRDRAIKVTTLFSVARGKDVAGVCPSAADLCASKLAALRDKDRDFVAALIDAGVVTTTEVAERVSALARLDAMARERALGWLKAYAESGAD